jgi:hypothetical protein
MRISNASTTTLAYLQAMTDQPRRRAVQDATHGERAAAGHARLFLNEVGGTVLRQVQQVFAFDLERCCIAPVAAHYHSAHELVVRGAVREVAMTSQLQGLVDLILQIAMRGLDAAILMTHATVVARAFHPVVLE